MKIYTRAGDEGTTSLLSGGEVEKDDPRLEAYGSLDELNSILGLLQSEPLPEKVRAELVWVQSALFSIGSHLADAEGKLESGAAAGWDVTRLEAWIDELDADLDSLRSFILPGGTRAAAIIHLARSVCRRAERRISSVVRKSDRSVVKGILPFVNRLSDAFFVLARWLNHSSGVVDVEWRSDSAE